jgi:spore maturation protein CgeB
MIFAANIAELEKRDPGLASRLREATGDGSVEIVQSRCGLPTICVERISLHSRYDPLKEARDWVRYHEDDIARAETLCVLGFGLGYHLQELITQTTADVCVFEPRLDVLKIAFDTRDLNAVLSRVKIVTDHAIPAMGQEVAILDHKPSHQLNPDYYDQVRGRIGAQQRLQEGIRVLVVGPIFGGSLPIARYCASALVRMGHRVEFVDNSSLAEHLRLARELSWKKDRYRTMVNHLTEFASETVMARCESFKPDLVLALAQAPLTPEHIRQLREKHVTCAYWFVEDFRVMHYWKQIAPLYDLFFTIQRGVFFKELEQAGVTGYSYLPGAAAPAVHRDCDLPAEDRAYYGSDLSFVGAGYYNRRHFFKGLIDYDLKIWGTDWDGASELGKCIQRSGERLEDEEIARIYSSARISVNLHSSTYHKGINPFGDFVNPRTFEIFSCGGFQLVDMRDGLDELFDIGEEIVTFRDLGDLRDKVSYFLEHPEERRRIAERGRERVLQEHTYENRMKEILSVAAERFLKETLWDEEGDCVEQMIHEAGRESELGAYLARFRERETITLSEIAEDIMGGEGDLSQTETVFLMMNEFVH